MGGGFGNTLENESAAWSPTDNFLAITYRVGRLDYEIEIYRIVSTNSGVRAIPQKVPGEQSGPEGKLIFSHLFHRANEGTAFEWLSPNQASLVRYGLMPPYPPIPEDNYVDDDGRIEIILAYNNDKWLVVGYKKPVKPILSVATSGNGGISSTFQYLSTTGFSALTLKNNKGQTLYRNDQLIKGSVDKGVWSNDGKFVVIRLGENDSTWLFRLKKRA